LSKKGKVLVAMSGGIDSTVAAMLLHEQGYEVIGVTMKTWEYEQVGGSKKETGCCSLDSINDAREIAVDHGFHHFIIDIKDEFGDFVIDNFVDEYMAGRTPNPCVLCNTHIKWAALLKRADQLDCEFIATGHYAKIKQAEGRYFISKAPDGNKDQSYVLWGLKQEFLARSMFPISDYTKPQIRQMAADRGYEQLSKKGESYEICFVPDNDYRGFLKRRKPELTSKLAGGAFISTGGEIIGHHEGYPFYTVGQRKGLGMAFGKPMFVSAIDAEQNIVTLSEEHELLRNGMMVGQLNLMKYDSIPNEIESKVKIRYKDDGTLGLLHQTNNMVQVEFLANVKGIAPGQSAVFYEGDDVIGGGIIQSGLMINEQ